ncbi:MAG: DUF3306 domain-containing protein [Burkholderiaceae bacterium]|nr:DUF3306 domain-containing protein [Burkholderiaceae bacterium]
MSEGEGFLGRWSRRKIQVREGAEPLEPPVADPVAPLAGIGAGLPAAGTPGAAPGPVAEAADPVRQNPAPPTGIPAPTLADAQALTPQSDFKPFIARGVAPEVRNTAMKKLFADPHYNVMDRLDTYIDDYSNPEPLPESMLRQMASAKFLGMFSEEKPASDEQAQADPARAGDVADTPPRQSVAQSDADADPPGAQTPPSESITPTAAPDAAISQNQHADTDLRLQPDHAPAGESPGRGAG